MIGVFDSGSGGLTVLAALVRRLPGEDFVYLGDHERAPYGGRSEAELYDLTIQHVETLFRRGCRLVVLACNTAAAVALRRLQQEWLPNAYPDRRVLGVLVPVVEAVTEVPWRRDHPAAPREQSGRPLDVGVFATRRTVESGAYRHEIERRAPAITVFQQACPDLVGKIESGASAREIRGVVEGYAAALCERTPKGRPDAVILGCTHYPLVEELFTACLPETTRILSQPALVAESLAAYLRRRPEFADPRGGGSLELLTTGSGSAADSAARRFLAGRILWCAPGFREIAVSWQSDTGRGSRDVDQRQAS